ncbi:hypoxia up-regulated 1 [Sporothrix schenckii 1099-18]|uniref:Hypoxia up-regulated 1 n=1 Tax=Sporothrix schenckii 1099-18 TaxID=1397361 RepID=A0A0F2MF70_SPOSC|nr:hypoxia up-regulated 1 [Sporothrix schenckii 1099-18]KJR86811.1 hypoxia up-regulated 1 [Sporothrix schenckii 1099-18]
MARRTISWRLAFAGLFLFACHTLAASAVLGVDLGTEYIKAALVKPGIPLDIVLTKDSRRKEISAVAFKTPQGGAKAGVYPERAYGSDAMALAARFPGDVFPNLKALLGLTMDGSDDANAVIQEYAARHPALKLEAAYKDRQTVALKSSGAFVDSEDAWMVEELLAMELKSVRRNAEALAGPDTSVRAAVITVPPFYTADEKRAVELAANLAGLRVLSLISDGLAVGLNYATSRQFPSVQEGGKPEVHMVFDMGAGSTKATVLRFQSRSIKDVGKFNKTVQEVDVLGSGWDRTLGGDALNALIVDDMVAQFVDSKAAQAAAITAASVQAHGRTIAKLAKEAERVRHVLSANTNTAASFEGLYNDIDFRYKISRADFEAMAEAHAVRVNAAVQDALRMAGLTVADLDSVILHGGATRTPFVQKQLEQIFGGSSKLRTNVNADEAAVFGAGFRAAELSPSFRVKEIRVAEGAVYGVSMKPASTDAAATNVIPERQIWVPTAHIGPAASKEELVYELGEDNKAEASVVFYQHIPGADGKLVASAVKTFTTSNLTDTFDKLVEKHACEPTTIQFKLGLRLGLETGEVEVIKAIAECEAEGPEKESLMDGVKNLFGFGKNKDQQPLKEGDEASETEDANASSSSSSNNTSSSSSGSSSSSSTTSSSTTSSSSASSSPTPAAADPSEPARKVPVAIPIKFTLEKAGTRALSDSEMQTVKKRLQAFDASDRARVQREESFNQLEAFTYKVRGLLESDSFIAASTPVERATLETMRGETSDWLYDGGVDATHEELKKKYTALKTPVDAIETRIAEAEKRPALIAGLREALVQSREFANSIRERIVEYEAFHASKSAAAAASSSSSSSSTTTSTAASSSESFATEADFDGLEDDEPPVVAEAATEEEPLEDRGPVPPIYTHEDLKESDELSASIASWLDEKEAAQAKLGPTDDPVLTAKELQAKRDHLDKVGMDLAMKAVRNFEKTQKKSGSGSKSSKSKKSSKTKTATATTKSEKTASTSSSSSTSSSAEAKPSQQAAQDEGIKHEEL